MPAGSLEPWEGDFPKKRYPVVLSDAITKKSKHDRSDPDSPSPRGITKLSFLSLPDNVDYSRPGVLKPVEGSDDLVTIDYHNKDKKGTRFVGNRAGPSADNTKDYVLLFFKDVFYLEPVGQTITGIRPLTEIAKGPPYTSKKTLDNNKNRLDVDSSQKKVGCETNEKKTYTSEKVLTICNSADYGPNEMIVFDDNYPATPNKSTEKKLTDKGRVRNHLAESNSQPTLERASLKEMDMIEETSDPDGVSLSAASANLGSEELVPMTPPPQLPPIYDVGSESEGSGTDSSVARFGHGSDEESD